MNSVLQAAACISQAHISKETRFVFRALRLISIARKQMSQAVLHEVIKKLVPETSQLKHYLLQLFPKCEDIEIAETHLMPETVTNETVLLVHLLCVLCLIDQNKTNDALKCCERLVLLSGKPLVSATDVVFDPLVASCYYYSALVTKSFHKSLRPIKELLFEVHSTANVRRMEETKITVLNVLLRFFIDQNQYDQADNLIARSVNNINEEFVSYGQMARFLYFDGVVKLFTLQYGKAYEVLQRALRKVPSTSVETISDKPTSFLLCFRRECVIRIALALLLQGEVPPRALFIEDSFGTSHYVKLVSAIRCGDLNEFGKVQQTYADAFARDGTALLVQRLRNTVIITGLKKLTLSYSRISFRDIGNMLAIPNVNDIGFIVAKAIGDGVIEGIIQHNNENAALGYLETPSGSSEYCTTKPVEELRKRIRAVCRLRSAAMRAMKYSSSSKKPFGLEDVVQTSTDSFLEDLMTDDDLS